MAQLTLDEFEEKPDKPFKCKYCGKSYKTSKGLKAHITRNHLGHDTWIAPDERVEIVKHSGFVDVRLRVRRALWKEIETVASRLNISEGDLIMMLLSSTGAIQEDTDEHRSAYIQ